MKSLACRTGLVLSCLAVVLVIVRLPSIEAWLLPPAGPVAFSDAPVPLEQRYAGLDSPLAGGVRVLLLDGQVVITADSVVVGKKRVGVFRLGVFNELVVPNLRVTIRSEACALWRARTAPRTGMAQAVQAEPADTSNESLSPGTGSAPAVAAVAVAGAQAAPAVVPAAQPAAPALLATATGVLASITRSALAGDAGRQRISTATVAPFTIVVERDGVSPVTILTCGKAVPEVSDQSARILLSGDVRLQNLAGATWRAKQAVLIFESTARPGSEQAARTVGHTPRDYLLLKHGLPGAIVDSLSISLTDGELVSAGKRSPFRHMKFPLALLVADASTPAVRSGEEGQEKSAQP